MAKKNSRGGTQTPSSAGSPIDSQGWPAEDPTTNVRALMDAAVQRQDDLRDQESMHVREIQDLRATFYEQLRKAEADRIDAIRAVDVGAVNRAAEVSSAQAQTLAAQVATSAETLRTQVQAAAAAAAIALTAALEPLQGAIADLRKIQYEQQGQKAQSAETKVDRRSSTSGWWVAVAGVVGVVMMLLFIASIGISIWLATKK